MEAVLKNSFTVKELESLTTSMKTGEASGLYKLPPGVIKEFASCAPKLLL